jgi:hypothetical protein
MRLVLVEWADSYGCSPTWRSLEEGAAPAKRLTCKSVGWLFRDDKECKVIVPHISDGEAIGISRQGCGDMTIPTKCVIRITPLGELSRRKPSHSNKVT